MEKKRWSGLVGGDATLFSGRGDVGEVGSVVAIASLRECVL